MKHELRNEKILGCALKYYEAKCALADEYVLKRKGKSGSDEDCDEDDDCDMWGDKLPRMEIKGGLAVIPIKGIISCGLPRLFKKFGFVDLNDVAKDAATAAADSSVRGIVFAVNSPGGTLEGLPEFAGMVAAIEKPTAARIDGLGCSAAYYAIAGCTIISTAPSSESVNIGVYQAVLDSSLAFKAFGYEMQIFKSGAYKGAGYPGTSLSDAQKTELQGAVDKLGGMFRAHVSKSRPKASTELMQGQSFFGDEAKALNFSDDDAPTSAEFLARFNADIAPFGRNQNLTS